MLFARQHLFFFKKIGKLVRKISQDGLKYLNISTSPPSVRSILLAEAKNNAAATSAVVVADNATENELTAGTADEAPPASSASSSSSSSCVSSSSNGLSTTLVTSLPTPVCAAAPMTSPVKLPLTDGEVTSPLAEGEELMTSAPEELVVAGGEGQIYYMLVDENSQLENQTILIGRRPVIGMSSSIFMSEFWIRLCFREPIGPETF
jgi:hypothetical protein